MSISYQLHNVETYRKLSQHNTSGHVQLDLFDFSISGPEPDNEHLSEFTDLSDYGQGEGRFFFFNLSTTISTAQAVALVLGITAVLGSIAALAFFFMLNMGGGGKDDSSHGEHDLLDRLSGFNKN